MRRKLTTSARHRRPARQVPVEFGDESWFPVPIRKGQAHAIDKDWNLPHCGNVKTDQPKTNLLAQHVYQQPRFNVSTSQRFNALSVSRKSKIRNQKFGRGFTLVEIMVVLALLGLIVFALMAVFAGTQRAFKASLTQTDTLEGGRAVMDLIANDLQTMSPSCFDSNFNANVNLANPLGYAPVNFYASPKTFALQASGPPSPLFQTLIGSSGSPPAQRTNVLEDIFILSKGNINGVSSWIGTGYSVNTNLADGTPYPLYRFYMTVPAAAGPNGIVSLFTNFNAFIYTNNSAYTNNGAWSHLMDGVVNLTARTYDTNGVWMTNAYFNNLLSSPVPPKFVRFHPDNFPVGLNTVETYCAFYSNALPASVQIELGTIEDRVLAHAEGLTGAGQSNYLSSASAQTHLFRQRISIPNVDRTAYQ